MDERRRRETFALGKVNADAMAHDCAHRREDTESVFGAVREVARRGGVEGRGVRSDGRSETIKAGGD